MYAAHTENPVQSTCILYIPQQSDNQITIHQITNPSEIPRWPPVHQEPAQALHARRNRRVLIFAVDISALNISAQRPGPHPSPPYQYTSTSIDEEAQRRFNGAPRVCRWARRDVDWPAADGRQSSRFWDRNLTEFIYRVQRGVFS